MYPLSVLFEVEEADCEGNSGEMCYRDEIIGCDWGSCWALDFHLDLGGAALEERTTTRPRNCQAIWTVVKRPEKQCVFYTE